MNPAAKNNCSSLEPNVYVCVGVSSSSTSYPQLLRPQVVGVNSIPIKTEWQRGVGSGWIADYVACIYVHMVVRASIVLRVEYCGDICTTTIHLFMV